jgi:phosphatidylglycerol:prolipoprotein diacylglycerol transferase
MLPALFGARLLYVATHWAHFRHDLRRICHRSEGGAAQYGGLALAVPISFPVLWSLDLPVGAFWDVGVITILVGMILTRVGCLLNGCCAGRPSSAWCSLYLPNRRGVWTRRMPTQCLEAVLAAALLGTALWVWPAMPFRGALFAFVVGGYGAGRLVLESMRELPPGQRFTAQHGISLGMVVMSVAVFTTRWHG